MLRDFGAEEVQAGELVMGAPGRPHTAKFLVTRLTAFRELLDMKSNWERSDRGTLVLDDIARRLAVKDRRQAVVLLSRFSSTPLC